MSWQCFIPAAACTKRRCGADVVRGVQSHIAMKYRVDYVRGNRKARSGPYDDRNGSDRIVALYALRIPHYP